MSGDLDDPVKPRGQEVRFTKANATGTWMFASSRARCNRSAIHAFDRKRPSRPITTKNGTQNEEKEAQS